MPIDTIRREDKDLGLKLLGGVPEGRNEANQTQIDEWLNKRHDLKPKGKLFHNFTEHFLLDYPQIGVQHPLFEKRDQDLLLRAFSEIQAPYKFPESIYIRDENPVIPEEEEEDIWEADNFIIKPPLFDEDLNLLNENIKIKKLTGQNKNSQKNLRIYSSTDRDFEIPVKCITHGEIHNLLAGESVMAAPDTWLQRSKINTTYPEEEISNYKKIGIGVENFRFDDPLWNQEDGSFGWYSWDDSGDEHRREWQETIQEKFMPRQGAGYSMLLDNVKGLSQGGNDNKVWIDPAYLSSISAVNNHRLFRNISHCYREDKCNFEDKEVGGINNVLYGFERNIFAQDDETDLYCRYLQKEPQISWQSRENNNKNWDRFCKFNGVPQRSVEYDRNYKLLITEILQNFRREGINYWLSRSSNYSEENIASGKYAMKTISSADDFEFGQALGQNEGTISTNERLIWYTSPKPVTNPEIDPEQYQIEFEDHINSRVFAKIWQYNDITSSLEEWIVELLDDYVSPLQRISEFEVVNDFTGGENPFVKDRRFAGKNNGGLRPYMIHIGFGVWIKSPQPYQLNPSGYYNIEGGRVMLTGDSEGDFFGDVFLLPDPEGRPQAVFVEVPSVIARGTVKPWGLPGEVITRNIVCWKKPTVIRWEHIKELRDRLLSPAEMADPYPDAMEQIGNLFRIKEQPNHILLGHTDGTGNRLVQGSGMVSNGDTPFSDIILLTDILHTRNLALPMKGYKLTPGIPNDRANDFEDSIQDFMSRKEEPHHLTVQRFGYREPGIYTFMANRLNNEKIETDVSQVLLIPSWLGKWPGGELEGETENGSNKLYRVFHPDGMRWWKDSGLLGCGVQFGEVKFDNENRNLNNGYGERGNGFTQEGIAVVNLFRRNVPLNKEIVAAYLRLIPTDSLEIPSTEVKTAGGGSQFTKGNIPFQNLEFTSQEFEDFRDSLASAGNYNYPEYEARIVYKEENGGSLDGFTYNEQEIFENNLELAQELMGEFEFPFDGSLEGAGPVGKPSGGPEGSYGTWKIIDPNKTYQGHLLDDIEISVATRVGDTSNFTTAQRSKKWYKEIWPSLIRGKHSMGNLTGIGNRFDYDENEQKYIVGYDEDDNRGLGFGCEAGGWAKDHRVFDITNEVRKAYALDRFDANYYSIVNKRLEEIEELILSLTTRDEPILDSIDINERILFYTGDIENIPNLLDETPSGEANEADENGFIILNLDLKQKIKSKVDSNLFGEQNNTASEIQLRDNYVVTEVNITASHSAPVENETFLMLMGRSYPKNNPTQSGWRIIDVFEFLSSGDNDFFFLGKPEIHQYRELKIITNAESIKKFEIKGKVLPKDYTIAPITDPPLSEIHDINKAIQERIKNSESLRTIYSFIPIENPVTKIYKVYLHPENNTSGVNNISKETNSSSHLELDYDGIFNPASPPQYEWVFEDSEWKIKSGTYQFVPSSNSIVIPPNKRWVLNKESEKFESTSEINDLHCSIIYNTGRGSKVELLIEAENTGPAYDVDEESIVEITESGISQLTDPSIINESFYGPAEENLGYSCYNPIELQGGYVRGSIPSDGHGVIKNYFFPENKDIDNPAWLNKCKGILNLFGEPNMEIPDRVEFRAPDFVQAFDPVTGEPLANGFNFDAGIDEFKIPNGGRIPGSIIIRMNVGDASLPDGVDTTKYRKKQVAFIPEILIYTRERTNVYNGSSSFGLTFEN